VQSFDLCRRERNRFRVIPSSCSFVAASIRNKMGTRRDSDERVQYFIMTINMGFNIFSINPIRLILSTTKSINYHVNYAHTPHVILHICFILHVNLENSNNQITYNNHTYYSRYRNAPGIIQM